MWQSPFTHRTRKQRGHNQEDGYDSQRPSPTAPLPNASSTSPSSSASWGTTVQQMSFWERHFRFEQLRKHYCATCLTAMFWPRPHNTTDGWLHLGLSYSPSLSEMELGSPFFLFYFPKYFESGAQSSFIWSKVCSEVLKEDLHGSQTLGSSR